MPGLFDGNVQSYQAALSETNASAPQIEFDRFRAGDYIRQQASNAGERLDS